jgi:hypothetical protein
MSDIATFKDCDSATVFDQVRKRASTQEARSLWNRLLQELERNGVDGAANYLDVEFRRMAENLERELTRLEVDQ